MERGRAEACIRAAFDAGITFFDTANTYAFGAADRVWGEILAGYARDSYLLATKLFWPMGPGLRPGLSAREVHSQLDASLARLRTDYVDLYQCHRFDPQTTIEETMEALSDVVRAGKARWIGFSEWTPEQIRAGLAVPGAVKFVSSQPQYNILWRGPEAEVFPLCAGHGISQIVWSPLAQGVPTGKYQPGQPPPAGTRGASAETGGSIQRYLRDALLEAVQRLAPIAEHAGLTLVQLALAWILRRPEVASAIIGASRPSQIHANVAASGLRLPEDVVVAIAEAVGAHAQTGFELAAGARDGVLHRRV